MTADPHQNRTGLRRFARWLALPLVLALLVFLQAGPRDLVVDATHNHPEIAGHNSLHLAAVKPAKPDLRLRTPDALLPADSALPAFHPKAGAAVLPKPAQPVTLRLQTGWQARAPPRFPA